MGKRFPCVDRRNDAKRCCLSNRSSEVDEVGGSVRTMPSSVIAAGPTVTRTTSVAATTPAAAAAAATTMSIKNLATPPTSTAAAGAAAGGGVCADTSTTATAEEMAEMAYRLLVDLGYATSSHDFNERLFLAPNNEAFVAVFQFLLPLLGRREYRTRFRFVLQIDDKRKEAEFRKVLCNYLQDLAKAGDLGSDVPPIKMALFTTPGRSTFLHVLLCVLEAVLRRKASTLGLVVPPASVTADTLQLGTEFYRMQIQANHQLSESLRSKMLAQVTSLVEDLQRTEAAVEKSRDELHQAQLQEQVFESDEQNLERYLSSLAQLAGISCRLERILELASTHVPVVDASKLAELPNDHVLTTLCPELETMVSQLSSQVTSNEVDLVLYLRYLNRAVAAFRSLYEDVVEKLTTGPSIHGLIGQQRNFLERINSTISRVEQVLHERQTKLGDMIASDRLITEISTAATGNGDSRSNLAEDLETSPVDITLFPPSAQEMKELRNCMTIPDLRRDGGPRCVSDAADGACRTEQSSSGASVDGSMAPPKLAVRRRKIRAILSNAAPPSAGGGDSLMLADLSGIRPLDRSDNMATPRIAQLKNDDRHHYRRRRSIKDIFTSTPLLRDD